MITAGNQLNAVEFDHTVVECGDGLHVQVVRRLVEDQAVGSADHHRGELAADLFSSGENLDLLDSVFSAEQHSAEEAADIGDILDLGIGGQPLRDVFFRVKKVGVVLFKIGLGGCDAPLVRAAVRLHVAHQNFEERRLGLLLGADEGNLVVMLYHKGDIVQKLYAADSFGKVLHGKDFISDFTVGTEINEGVLPGGGLDFVKLNFLQSTLSGGCLLGFGSVRGEAGDELLQLLDLFLLLLVGLLHLTDHQLRGLVPEVVVSGIKSNLAVIDVRDVRAHLVEEITVMGNHDDDVGEIDQEFLQPCDGIKVQVVCRLVEEKNVRASEERSCKKNLHLLGTVQITHLLIVILILNAKAVQKRLGIGLGFVAAHLGIFAFELCGADAVLVGEIRLGIKLVLLSADFIELLIALNDRVQNDLVVVFLVILLQEGKTLAGGNCDFAGGRIQLTGENLQKSRFSGAVCADDTVAASLCEFDIDIFKQGFLADPVGNVVG